MAPLGKGIILSTTVHMPLTGLLDVNLTHCVRLFPQKQSQDKDLYVSCLFTSWFLEILVGKWEVRRDREEH